MQLSNLARQTLKAAIPMDGQESRTATTIAGRKKLLKPSDTALCSSYCRSTELDSIRLQRFYIALPPGSRCHGVYLTAAIIIGAIGFVESEDM